MNSSSTPEVTEFFEKADSMLPGSLVEAIYRFTQIFLRCVPAMMRDLFLQSFPSCFFRIRFRGVSREVNNTQTAVRCEPILNFITGVMAGLINPQDDLPARTSRKYLFQPADRRVRILPVNDKRDDLRSRPQMDCAIKILGAFAARSVSNERLFPDRIPAPGQRSFEIDFALITSQGRHLFPTSSQFLQRCGGFALEAQLLGGAALDVKLTPALIAPIEHAHQLLHAAPTVGEVETLLDQNANCFDGPPAAHLSAWHRFLLKQLTELVQFSRLQAALAMLPSPAGMILQTVQTLLLIGLHPAADGFFINEENVCGLTITITLGHQQQR